MIFAILPAHSTYFPEPVFSPTSHMDLLPYIQMRQILVTHQMNCTPKVQRSSESTRVHTEYMHAELTVQ